MQKQKFGILIFLTLFIATTSLAQQKEQTVSLSLQDCILKAMKNNLGVAAEVLSPELSDIAVASAREKFLPSLSFNLGTSNTNQASYSWLEAARNVITERSNYSGELSQLIPTGGNFSVSLDQRTTDSNQKLQTVNPRYSSALTFSFNQPLLKNFGIKMTQREIIIAKNNLGISETRLKNTLQQTVYQVEEAYWNLVYSLENLTVIKQSLKLAQDSLDKNRKAVEVGTLAPMEVLSAQSEVASRQADLLQAEASYKDAEDRLKTIINLAAEVEGADLAKIIPTDKPSYEKKEVSLDEALRKAMENRPDLQETRIDLKNKEINLSYSKNQLLPGLNLIASYWSPGLSGTQYEYDPRDPFGDPIAIYPGKASDSFKDVFDFKYKNWSAALVLDVPLNTFISRAAYARSRIELEQAQLRQKNQEQQVFLELKSAVRAVQTYYKQVQARKIARELNEKKLEAEEERLKVGLTTPFVVLQYQRDLASSRTQELRAIIDYNLSSARLSQAMGIGLKEKSISIAEILGD